MTAETPTGWRSDIANLSRSSDGTVCPYRRRPSPAMKYVMSMASWTSPRVSSSTLPISRVMSRASISLRSASSCAARNSISARRGAGTSRQCSYARRAASIARSTSWLVDCWNTPTSSSALAGLRFSNRSPETDGTHEPSMKLLWTVPWVVLSAVVVMRLRVPYRGQALQPWRTGCSRSRTRNGAKSLPEPSRVVVASIFGNKPTKTDRNAGILDSTAVARFLNTPVLSAGDGHRC